MEGSDTGANSRVDVAHALLRAASALLPTPVRARDEVSRRVSTRHAESVRHIRAAVALVCWMSVRTLIVFALAGALAQAQSPLVKILSDELDRNFSVLKQKGDPPPYFMGYEVTDDQGQVITASRGSLDTDNHAHRRSLDVTVRVGGPQFDNYRKVGNDRPRFTPGSAIALTDNPVAIRQSVWLATDRVYRAASNRLIRIKADEKLRPRPRTNRTIFQPKSRKCSSRPRRTQIQRRRMDHAPAQTVRRVYQVSGRAELRGRRRSASG